MRSSRKSSSRRDRSWYKLDNAGKIYPALLSRRISSLFRLSLTLDEPVSLPLLSRALEDVMPRFPYYQVSLRPGFFWYFLETNPKSPLIEGDSLYPCMKMPLKKKGQFLFRFRIYKNRIALEFSHILSDGNGALIFLKTLTAQYLRLKGHTIEADEEAGIFDLEKEPDPGEFEDSFHKHYDRSIPEATRGARAFHIKGRFIPSGQYNVITGIMSVKEVKEQAGKYGVSIGEFLVAQLIAAYQEYIENADIKQRRKLPIRMNVPVNLRTLYPSKTMRNFFLSVEPWIDPRLGHYEFEEICAKVHHYMRYELDRKFLNQQITRNMKGELSIINRLFPLHFKNLIMPSIYRILGENNYTSGFSNLGRVDFPESMKPFIKSVDFYPPPSTGNAVKCTTLSYGDEMRISFGSQIKETEIERLFFTSLRKKDIRVRMESNRIY
ncbi:MAG: alcohol acetyltransferase [Spirochaetales bacterium]|nr:alcohol acetyltransferase [Spirochaetales bacterium]